MESSDMHKHRRLIGLQQLLDEDLDAICTDLTAEFGAMSGGRLLVTGGGGFLGYYLVQSILHWNDTRAAGGKINIAVYDNYARGVPEWLEALRGRPDLELRRHDMIEPLPRDIGHFDYVVHAAGIASPIYYRAQPLKCIDANVNGLRNLLDYAVAECERGQPLNFGSGQPKSRCRFTPRRNASHVAQVKTSAGPSGNRESRSATPPASSAASRQLPLGLL